MKSPTYVPILRWKKAEKDALEALDPNIRNQIAPLFEFIMPPPIRDKKEFKKVVKESKTVFTDRLSKTIEDINKCSPGGTVYVDVHLVDWDLRVSTLKYILDSANECNAIIIPVTHILPVLGTETDKKVRMTAIDYAKSGAAGLCIRIDRISLDEATLVSDINDFVRGNGLAFENTDLLIDLGVIDEDDEALMIAEKLAALPNLQEWRNVIVTGGAFPKDLSKFEKHSYHKLPRYDWKLWKDLYAARTLDRIPVYSDYTIQHPIFYGNVLTTNVSASIRYTNDTQWEVMRGEGLNNETGAGHRQYIAHAQTLVRRGFYKGKDCCFGDLYIYERSGPENENTGTPTTWLKAGINHHLTMVVKQSAKSPEGK